MSASSTIRGFCQTTIDSCQEQQDRVSGQVCANKTIAEARLDQGVSNPSHSIACPITPLTAPKLGAFPKEPLPHRAECHGLFGAPPPRTGGRVRPGVPCSE